MRFKKIVEMFENGNFKTIVKMFENGNVCVTGLIGTGKDMLTGNVIARRKEVSYASNLNYGGKYIKLDFNDIDCGKNDYRSFISGRVKYYKCPYPYKTDVYISDCGIYFPSQYNSELNRDFKYLPTFFALSRQVNRSHVHCNVQNLNRCWDKLREMSDQYIRCKRCVVLFGKLVIQNVTIYDKYQSCLDRVEPARITVPFLAKREVKQNAKMYLDKFRNTYGKVENKLLIYINKSNYDTYYFEKLLEGGAKSEV